ncbi:TIGR04255 family protein [Methylomagnum ishizawai]|uniref:TIGR04255 family protein n=1 Tax=Methylomagnum ishizawai TaxID=1760988 RepID=UPI001C32D96B|nr:TIGR04255 family protein [Methylomagnum ishizawai]BBL76534.1 hypothetical protein MishRS11D_36320 [Methylomagnum ishizawai]
MGQPINDKHAIEVAAFIVAFERPFSERSIEALLGLQELLKADYPAFNKIGVFKISFGDKTAPSQPSNKISGVLLQKFRTDGRPAWALRVENNNIIVSCFDYERWEPSSSKAIEHLKKVINIIYVYDEQNPLGIVALQVIDRFVSHDDGYDIGHVFNRKTRYLTKQAIEAGSLWHVHQGWFREEKTVDVKYSCLNTLNVSASSGPVGLISTIDHTLECRFKQGLSVCEALDEDFLRDIFGLLHGYNKDVVGDLLNSRQKKRIGL